MTTAELIMIAVVVAGFSYPVIMRIVAIGMQPTRIKMVKLSEDVLSSPLLNARQKQLIESMLEDIYSPKLMFLVAAFLPFYLLARACGYRNEDHPFRHIPESFSGRIKKIQNYHLRSVIAANPLAAIIVAIEIALLVLPLWICGIFKNHSNSGGNVGAQARNIVSEIEAQRTHINHRLAA